MNEVSQMKRRFTDGEGQCALLCDGVTSAAGWGEAALRGLVCKNGQTHSPKCLLPISHRSRYRMIYIDMRLKSFDRAVSSCCLLSHRSRNLQTKMMCKTSSLRSFPCFEIFILISGLLSFNRQIFIPLPSGFSFTNRKNSSCSSSHLERFENWACANLMKFNKAK